MRWHIYNNCDNEWWRQKKMATFERMLLGRKHVIIAERYNVIRKIGGGSFGDIFLAININDGEVNTCSNIIFSIDLHSYITTSCVKSPVYFGILFTKMAVRAYSYRKYTVFESYLSMRKIKCVVCDHLMFYVIWPLCSFQKS